MSINVSQAIGEAIIQQCERAGFRLWVDEGSAQVRIRDAMADPADNSSAERNRAAGHTPRMLPGQLTSELNNKRGSVLVALRARQTKADAPVAVEASDAPKGVINTPGFGETPVQKVDPTVDPVPPEMDPLLQDMDSL